MPKKQVKPCTELSEKVLNEMLFGWLFPKKR